MQRFFPTQVCTMPLSDEYLFCCVDSSLYTCQKQHVYAEGSIGAEEGTPGTRSMSPKIAENPIDL